MLNSLQDPDNGAPLANRAVQGGYPTGSTFKLITATAALESGLITPDSVLNDPGSYTVGGVTFNNAGGVAHGALALRQALTVSSDVFFYQLGDQLNSNGDGLALQHWAHRYGIGRDTGIDLPNELPGLLPTPKWRNDLYDKGDTDRPWGPGDNVNLSVGQGDLRADPMQMAVAYAAIATDRVLRPRLGQRIEDSSGRALQQLEAPTARKLGVRPEYRQAILDGLRGAASAPGGTSAPVFADFPIQVAGKTGTAEKGLGRADQSWYVALAPYPEPEVRGGRDRRGGRLRSGHRRADGPPHPRRPLQRQGESARAGRRPVGLMAASPVTDFRERGIRMLPIDPLLLLAVLGLTAASLYVVGTATQDDIPGDPNYYLVRQAGYAGVGLVLMLLISRFDYSRLREWKTGIYGLMIASILLVSLLGFSARGSKRAIEFGFINFQASELGKLLLILSLSAFVVDRMRRLGDRDTTSRIILLTLFPAMLVITQPDLGSGLVYLAIALAVLFVAGTKWTHFAALGGLAVAAVLIVLVAAPAVGIEVLKPYQVDRLTAFLNPTNNPAKEGYQINQSLTAIGSGGKTGRGDEATQTRLDFLPEHHTDFIFSVVGEELGFVGAAIVLSLFALLIWRALRILTMAKNLYGALIAGGITAMVMFQVFVNVGMTIGIMPITGVPLPLVSYGGSSVLVTFMALGVLQSIYARARETAYAKGL